MTDILRVLYAEDSVVDADLTRRHLQLNAPHIDLEVVGTGQEFLARLDHKAFDLVLADLRLPDTSALDLLRESNYRNLRVPFIVVTDRGDEEAAAAALKLGAYDYIVKGDAYLTQLPYAIDNAISRARLQDSNRRLLIELAERTRAEERIRHLNADLEQRVVQRTRELESANEELEDTAILELIAENAPVPEICTRLASLLARRTNTVVSVTAFPPLDRFRGIRSAASPESPETGSADHTRITSASLASLAIATPDGRAYSTASRHLADATLLETLAAAERMPVHAWKPVVSIPTLAARRGERHPAATMSAVPSFHPRLAT